VRRPNSRRWAAGEAALWSLPGLGGPTVRAGYRRWDRREEHV